MDAPWMQVALAEVGQRELAGARNNNPRILEYLGTVGHFPTDETAWCSAFANWVMLQSGLQGSGRPNARSWLHWGFPLAHPEYGCITVFRRGHSSWQGHVAFYVRQEGHHLLVLGGNQGDAVSIARHSRSSLLGYRWPQPVGEVITRDQSGRITSRENIEGMVISGSPR
ncbi:MAG TPA: TIGR02594 family protein [Isosphaeraceae bacterium]|nr:TIGR02594 family protein [Isosphaeraceae bacterium]